MLYTLANRLSRLTATVPHLYSKNGATHPPLVHDATYHPHQDQRLFRLVSTSSNNAAANASTAAAIGGGLIAGGGALALVAQATGTVLGAGTAASATGAILFTGGLALVAVGIFLIAYYGYQWVQSQGGSCSHALIYANGGYACDDC